MGIKKIKPITPGQRFKTTNTFEELTTSSPEKSLLVSNKRSGGRNNDGKMTMRHIGGGHKKKYRLIDFNRDKDGIPAVVKSVEYDPNRSAFISLLFYSDGEKRYIINVEGLKEGDTILSGKDANPDTGNALFIEDIPLGTVISCIEMSPGKGAVLARSAGSFAQLMAKREDSYAIIKLPSGEIRKVLLKCKAVIGVVSNQSHQLVVSGKAGRSRWKNNNGEENLESLYISEVFVGEGVMLKRIQPAPQGRAHRIRKRRSHITLILDSKK